jgi:hypothetical protein
MPPYLPLVSLTKNQQVRLGRGVGSSVPTKLASGITADPQTGRIFYAFYADLGNGQVRRDLQHHTTLGSVLPVGPLTNAHNSDLFSSNASAVSAGTGLTVNVASQTITSRLFGNTIVAPAQTVALPPLAGDAYYTVYVDGSGKVGAGAGTPAPFAGPTPEVDSVTITGTPTGGTFTLSFTYNGFHYTTANIAYNAAATAVATAVSGATSTNGGPALEGAFTGAGGALPGAAVTLTAGAGIEGPLASLTAASALTGGTPAITYLQVVPGAGATLPSFGGAVLPLAEVFVPATATTSGNFTIENVAPQS